jgi:hypothetical protein
MVAGGAIDRDRRMIGVDEVFELGMEESGAEIVENEYLQSVSNRRVQCPGRTSERRATSWDLAAADHTLLRDLSAGSLRL